MRTKRRRLEARGRGRRRSYTRRSGQRGTITRVVEVWSSTMVSAESELRERSVGVSLKYRLLSCHTLMSRWLAALVSQQRRNVVQP